ncbi:MAG TPA: hypothetical protein VIN59_04100 [Alphaproteobacteria bacterium]
MRFIDLLKKNNDFATKFYMRQMSEIFDDYTPSASQELAAFGIRLASFYGGIGASLGLTVLSMGAGPIAGPALLVASIAVAGATILDMSFESSETVPSLLMFGFSKLIGTSASLAGVDLKEKAERIAAYKLDPRSTKFNGSKSQVVYTHSHYYHTVEKIPLVDLREHFAQSADYMRSDMIECAANRNPLASLFAPNPPTLGVAG